MPFKQQSFAPFLEFNEYNWSLNLLDALSRLLSGDEKEFLWKKLIAGFQLQLDARQNKKEWLQRLMDMHNMRRWIFFVQFFLHSPFFRKQFSSLVKQVLVTFSSLHYKIHTKLRFYPSTRVFFLLFCSSSSSQAELELTDSSEIFHMRLWTSRWFACI